MVIDSSALLAVLLAEAEASRFLDQISRDETKHISTATLAECQIVTLRALGEVGLQELRLLLLLGQIEPIALTADHVTWALQGWRRYGRGRHVANLNLGDCFSYALAKALQEPLLYKGDDFPLTDVLSVDLPI